MTTIAFKTQEEFKTVLEKVAGLKGISLSALIKLYLTDRLRDELSAITENGMTLGEELEILLTIQEGSYSKAYDDVEELIRDLNAKG